MVGNPHDRELHHPPMIFSPLCQGVQKETKLFGKLQKLGFYNAFYTKYDEAKVKANGFLDVSLINEVCHTAGGSFSLPDSWLFSHFDLLERMKRTKAFSPGFCPESSLGPTRTLGHRSGVGGTGWSFGRGPGLAGWSPPPLAVKNCVS